MIALFDASGQLIRTLDLDAMGLSMAGAAPQAPVSVQFAQLSWSPDARELAVGYWVLRTSGTPATNPFLVSGVALFPADGSGGRRFAS
ncbi:MAG: hypothetical protein IVW57_15400 [Ktedonobacterales bacterium]|nr:hypothetical protein [Ktedonobacterales bacterium]